MLVVGTGLLGASVGLALRRADVDVLLEDTDDAARDEAVARGAGRARRDGDVPVLVVVAVPPAAAGAVLARELARWPQATVTDVTSVKTRPLAQAVAAGGGAERLVGGHPMAGREVSGPGAARADLFDDRVWVLTPLPGTEPERLEQVRALVQTCGGLPVQLAPEDHDRAVALTSHSPQVLSSLLASRLADAQQAYVEVSGQGLRDVTRIAASDPALWAEILGANATPVADVLDVVAQDLARVVDALRALGGSGADPEPREVLVDVLARGNAGHARVPGKHGAEARPYVAVPVKVADRPGELARLFVAAGDLGINLEDVRIEHVLGRPSGLVELAVRPAVAADLVEGLRRRGFDVRA
ncbi:MAG: prephenate dehydrogenase [Candidatus Nanopelagicales bacterium]